MEPLHDRTPVQIPPDLWNDWLDPNADPAKLKYLFDAL